jgi:membrane fusion protein (multidrug efflux system)
LKTYAKIDRTAMEHLEFILADNSAYPFQGRYANIARSMDPKTGTIQIEALFPNPTGILVPGMSGRIRMPIQPHANAVLVPNPAVFDVNGEKAVDIVTPEKRVAIRIVETAGSYQNKTVVTKGLSGGEIVIVDGAAKLKAGDRVTTRPAKATP